MTHRLKLFAVAFAAIAGGMGGALLLAWLLAAFVTLELPHFYWAVARFVVSLAFMTALAIAIFEGGDGA